MRAPRVLALQLTVTLGAFLLFLVQPMAARFLLSWFGGAPSVWSTCLLFFQAALLAGYGYAHEHDFEAARMEKRETRILKRLGYPDPYTHHG